MILVGFVKIKDLSHIYLIICTSFIDSFTFDYILFRFSVKNKANNFASRQVVRAYSITRRKHNPSRGNKKAILSAVTLNSYLDGNSLTASGGRNTLFFSWLSRFVCLRIPAIEPTNPAISSVNPLATPQSYGIRILAIRDILVRLAGLPSPRLPSARVWTPCCPSLPPSLLPVHRPARLGRISRYSLDVAHRFESVFESWNRGARSRVARRGSAWDRIQEIALNPITSETPEGDVYETFRGEYREKKEARSICTDSCRNYGLCGISCTERQILRD